MPFIIVDGHEDLLWHLRQAKEKRQTSPNMLNQSSVKALFASIFTDDVEERQRCAHIHREITDYQRMLNAHPHLCQIKSFGDFDRTIHQSDQTGIMLHVEGMDCLNEHNWQTELPVWRMYGVISGGIVWNNSNRLGGGAHEYGSLTQLGQNVIRWMNRNDMIVDLAHTNPGTFFNILDVISRPPIISHGNVKARANRRRNYTNEQLRALADHDGVIGISFVPGFVRVGGQAALNNLAEHIKHVVDLVGLRHVAIGSDFGGILSEHMIPRASSVLEIDILLYTLERCGFFENEIELFAYQNWERVLRANLL